MGWLLPFLPSFKRRVEAEHPASELKWPPSQSQKPLPRKQARFEKASQNRESKPEPSRESIRNRHRPKLDESHIALLKLVRPVDKKYNPQDEAQVGVMFGPLGYKCHLAEHPEPTSSELPDLYEKLHQKIKNLYIETRGEVKLDELRTELTKLVIEFYEYDKVLQAARDTLDETNKRRKTSKPEASKRKGLVEAFKEHYCGTEDALEAFKGNGERFKQLLHEYDSCFEARGAASDSSHENPASDSEPAGASRSGSAQTVASPDRAIIN